MLLLPSGTIMETRDISNISTTEAFRYFPYDIYPLELDAALTVQLIENPAFLIQGFSGLQPLIQQAMQDFGMSYSDYGIKGKGKNEGKGKDRAQGKKSSGKGWGNSRKGEIFERLDQEGKGNKNSRSKPYQPYSKKEYVQDYSQTSRPSAWYTAKDYDSWENDSGWPQASSSQARSQDNSKGWSSPAPKGKGQNRSNSESDTNIFLVVNVWLLQVQVNPVIFASMSIGNIVTFSLGPFVLSLNSHNPSSLVSPAQLNFPMEKTVQQFSPCLERENVLGALFSGTTSSSTTPKRLRLSPPMKVLSTLAMKDQLLQF